MDTSKYKNTEAFQAGLKVRREVLGDGYVEPSIKRGAEDEFTRKLQQFVTEHAWGTVWCSDGLERKTRSTINLALLAALGRPAELKLHTRRHHQRHDQGRDSRSVPAGRRLCRRTRRRRGIPRGQGRVR